ncbi:phytanoyl-coa dioxygenase 1-like [Plakobranchus ocellatus]|uniref:Phytanoyl-coa dioxygenase 1-like n=1 Tax=Plakobranchus ocellatus TaxID=259542 RepID=A0AAV3YA56_9GAST|nr:phytanoyl-coa dioxygenase 1-like [Plakobranchus ocellatus]
MASSQRKRYPGDVDAAYPDPFTVAPSDVKDRKPGQLPREESQKFFDEGYIVVKDYFTREELDPCREDIALMVDQLAQKLYSAGKISDNTQQTFSFSEVRTPTSKSFQRLWTNDRLLNLMEQILGPEVAGHPVWNLRTKTPRSEAVNIPWHQGKVILGSAQ